MYVPKYAEVTDREFLKTFIADHNFGELISISDNAPYGGHYPFLVEEEDGKMILFTHLARSNPQWKHFATKPNCVAIFTGPHSYISPKYYESSLQVPTWSYTAVHVNASVEVVNNGELERQLMARLVRHHEEKNGTNWNYELPEEFHQKLLRAIVWLRLTETKLEGKFKLSQNREKADYEKTIAEFSGRVSDNDRELLKYMKLTRKD